MKKSLKVLILCVLTSFVMFAVVYASPIVAKATANNVYTIITEDTSAPCGQVTFTTDGNVDIYSGAAFVAGYFNTTNVGVLLQVYGEPLGSDYGCIYGAYDFTFAGGNYSGTAVLSRTGSVTFSGVPYEVYRYLGPASLNNGPSGYSGYNKELSDLTNMIAFISGDSSLTGDKRVVEFNAGDSLPGYVLAALANSNDVTLKFTFVYEGFEFCTTITSEDAKKVYDPAIEWYGPCYLALKFPTVWTGKTVA